MYFITKKDSETGKKFQVISEKKGIVLKAQKEFANKYGFTSWYQAYWCIFGGMSSCLDFKETPNSKIWRKVSNKDEYYPKKNTKESKEIYNEISNLPRVSIDELNMCIDFKGAPFKNIGFAEDNDEYFGFKVDFNWNVKIPNDCEEITVSRYNELFKIKNGIN